MTTYPLPGLVLSPSPYSATINITNPAGQQPAVYADPYGVTPITLPVAVGAPTKVYIAGDGPWLVNGQSIMLEGAQVGSLGPPPPYVTYASLSSLQTWYLDNFIGTDDQKMALALGAWAASSSGGTIVLPPRTCTFSNQWTTTYNASTVQYLGIRAAGFGANGSWNATTGATIVEHDYGGAGVAKADFQHVGTIEMCGFLMQDSSGGSVPFVFTSNAQPQIHDMGFRGSKTGTSCNQDAIILGGTGSSKGAGDTAPFQGYGGTVQRVFIDGIRRLTLAQTFCNGVVISDNTVSLTCGSNQSNDAPFVFNPGTSTVSGNVVERNTVEVGHYAYLAVASNAVNNTFGPNGAYDQGAGTQGVYYFTNTSTFNMVVAGYNVDTIPLITEDSTSTNSNTVLTAHQSQRSTFGQYVRGWQGFEAINDSNSGGLGFNTISRGGDVGTIAMQQGNFPDSQMNLIGRSGVSFSDGVTNGTTTFTSATATFVAADVGSIIFSSGNIPFPTYILQRVNATTVLLSQPATTSSSGLTFFMQRSSGTAWNFLSLARGHLVSPTNGSTTISASTAAGSSPTISLTGNDMAGTISLTVGTGPSTGQLFDVACANNYTATPRVFLFPRNQNAANTMNTLWNTGSTSQLILLQTSSALSAGQVYLWDYVAIQ